ncbi:hypothetical protein ABZY81_42645 [Streptomyces sp. NPDC006514]|uniref:hypothetical protein n=1 Tax=Streptomyces sp. NPDC006514 TaxID=3154308 RepID=UPI0033B02E3B
MQLVAELVRSRPAHVRFLVRERHGGDTAVREAIAAQLDALAAKIDAVLVADPLSAGWGTADVTMLSRLLVGHMFMTASACLTTSLRGEDWSPVLATARDQLCLIHLGREHWQDEKRPTGPIPDPVRIRHRGGREAPPEELPHRTATPAIGWSVFVAVVVQVLV